MTRSTIRSYSFIAALALSSSLTFAAEKSPKNETSSAQPKTEQICEVHPEYSCVEVPTVYGYESAKVAKQAKRQKASVQNAKAAEITGSSTASSQPQNGN